MTISAVIPERLSPFFQKNDRDLLTGEPCFPATTVSVKHNGRETIVVHPASSSPKTLRARFNGIEKVLGVISPLYNYVVKDPRIPTDASFIIT